MKHESPRPCYVCGGTMTEGCATVSYLDDIEPLLIERVPALICDQCGEQAYTSDVVSVLERMRERGGTPSRILSVPVYEFATAEQAAMATSER